MRVLDEVLDLQWANPLDAVADLPELMLYGVVLTIVHSAGKQALEAVRAALEPSLGPATARQGLLGKSLRFSKKTLAEADVRRGKATLRFGQRLRPNRLADVVRAVAVLPGAADLRLKGTVRRFAAPGPDGPAMDG